MIKYVILVFVILIMWFAICYSVNKKRNMKEEEMYDKYLKKIKKAFVNLLVSIDTVPNPNKKSVVRLNHIDDLVDISLRIKKPIYYIEKDNRTCDFILIDGSVYNIYSLKINEEFMSAYDVYVSSDGDSKDNFGSKIFDELIKTTIIKLPNGEVFKVSPLKRRNKKEMEIEMPRERSK